MKTSSLIRSMFAVLKQHMLDIPGRLFVATGEAGPGLFSYPRRGHSVAHGKRMARKARNVKRTRAAMKRSGR